MSDQTPLEETPEAAAAVADETTVPQLVTGGGADADTPPFVEPGEEEDDGEFVIGESDGIDDDVVARTGAEQEWEPVDLAEAEGRDPTPANVERAARELAEEGPAAIEKTVP
jgi:hypothetical protein